MYIYREDPRYCNSIAIEMAINFTLYHSMDYIIPMFHCNHSRSQLDQTNVNPRQVAARLISIWHSICLRWWPESEKIDLYIQGKERGDRKNGWRWCSIATNVVYIEHIWTWTQVGLSIAIFLFAQHHRCIHAHTHAYQSRWVRCSHVNTQWDCIAH